MVGELVAEEGEVVLFQGRGGEGGFGVEDAGEVGDGGFTLRGRVSGWTLAVVV